MAEASDARWLIAAGTFAGVVVGGLGGFTLVVKAPQPVASSAPIAPAARAQAESVAAPKEQQQSHAPQRVGEMTPTEFAKGYDGIVLFVPGELLRNADSPLDFFFDISAGIVAVMEHAKKTGENQTPGEKANAAIEMCIINQMDEIGRSGRWDSSLPPLFRERDRQSEALQTPVSRGPNER